MTHIVSLYKKYRNFVLYALFGLVAAVIDYVISAIFMHFAVFDKPEICSLIGNVCGFIFTFMTNTLVNFKKRSEYMKTFASYATICIAGSLISTLLIHLFKSSMNIYVLKFVVMIFVCLLQYFLNRTITYKN